MNQSNVQMYIKAAYVLVIGLSIVLYVFVKNKLANKLINKPESIIVARVYYYLYLAVVVFLVRGITAYMLKDGMNIMGVTPSMSLGLGSYINNALGIIINNQMYANVIINTILAFGSCILIKKIILNILDNDTVATAISIIYSVLPQSLFYVGEYVRCNYNVVLVLTGILLCIKIIDEVKNFNKKSNKYLIYTGVLAGIAALDVVLGGSSVFWIAILVITTLAATYIDCTRIEIPFKNKLNYKLKNIVLKIEKISIPKLVYVAGIISIMLLIPTIFIGTSESINNYQFFNVGNALKILMHSRSYYLVLIIMALGFEIIGFFLKRKLDIKMFIIKVAFIVSSIILFFMLDGIYVSAVWDTLLVLTTITNICAICYNREERIKLLKEKN